LAMLLSGVLIGRMPYRANEGRALKKRQSNYILEIMDRVNIS
jgi:hypothetical protein